MKRKIKIFKAKISDVLDYFGYKKWDSMKTLRDGSIMISSPFGVDSSPSFHMTDDVKWFDFSNNTEAAKGGDSLRLIALLGNLDLNSDFQKILTINRRILCNMMKKTN